MKGVQSFSTTALQINKPQHRPHISNSRYHNPMKDPTRRAQPLQRKLFNGAEGGVGGDSDPTTPPPPDLLTLQEETHYKKIGPSKCPISMGSDSL